MPWFVTVNQMSSSNSHPTSFPAMSAQFAAATPCLSFGQRRRLPRLSSPTQPRSPPPEFRYGLREAHGLHFWLSRDQSATLPSQWPQHVLGPNLLVGLSSHVQRTYRLLVRYSILITELVEVYFHLYKHFICEHVSMTQPTRDSHQLK
jgi:hypothetical protein